MYFHGIHIWNGLEYHMEFCTGSAITWNFCQGENSGAITWKFHVNTWKKHTGLASPSTTLL